MDETSILFTTRSIVIKYNDKLPHIDTLSISNERKFNCKRYSRDGSGDAAKLFCTFRIYKNAIALTAEYVVGMLIFYFYL